MDQGYFEHVGRRGTVQYVYNQKGNGIWWAYPNVSIPQVCKSYQRAVDYVREHGMIIEKED